MATPLLPSNAPGSRLVVSVPVTRSSQDVILARRPILGQRKNVSVRMSLFFRQRQGIKALERYSPGNREKEGEGRTYCVTRSEGLYNWDGGKSAKGLTLCSRT